MTIYVVSMEVRDGARKHGVSDDDMRHAVRHAIRSRELDDNTTLLIGADTGGRLLEVVVADIDSAQSRIIHAMALRPSFYRLL
ncbi:MAG TPA: toxin [Candidatus Ruania gallistercoris]|uniref:Toxin n=1 Tax=Candidatus Ruania gallistercoris TaxID=2838746 RepID=A0A9D2EFT4_9MICO|nr:toxin [Candidatus Ruania gallistercoris]